jgi:putative phage-type endonuclease
MEQRTDDWFKARLGKATASRMADILAKTKSGYGASRANYRTELIVERLTEKPTETFKSFAMQEGIDMEPDAVDAYEFFCCENTKECGFEQHPTIEMAGASPDRFVVSQAGEIVGLLEVKCPQPKAHWNTLLTDKIPSGYVKQMLWQLACKPVAMFNDYVSFNNRFPTDMQLYVQRLHRKDHGDAIEEMESEVEKFLVEIEKEIEKGVKKLYRPSKKLLEAG